MSDDISQPEAVEPVENANAQDEQRMFDEAYVKKLREEAAGYRVRLKEFEDSQKSEAEKAAERVAALESENAAFKRRDQVAQWAAGIVKGSSVPASALRGDSEESLREHFDELKSLIPEQRKRVPNTWDTPAPGAVPDSDFVSQLFGRS